MNGDHVGRLTRVRRRLLAVLITVALASTVLASCDDDSGGAGEAGSSRTGGPAGSDPTSPGDPVEFRPVAFSDLTPAPSCSAGSEGPAAGCPPDQLLTEFDSVDCSTDPPPRAPTAPDEPVVACSQAQDGESGSTPATKYALEPARIVGGVVEADPGIPEGQPGWVVNVRLDDAATAAFAELSEELAGTQRQLAILLEGLVITAPTINGPITGGLVQITGDLTEDDARSLASRLVGPGD